MVSGMDYAPKGKPNPVVKEGEFIFAAVGLDHGHIGGMCNGLIEAGATLKYIYDPDPKKLEKYLGMYPQAKAARSAEEVLEDPEIALVANAGIASERCPFGIRVMEAGKDYFTDKAPLTTLKQLEDAKGTVEKTGKKYAVYYSERLHVEAAIFAGQLIEEGAIGRLSKQWVWGLTVQGLAGDQTGFSSVNNMVVFFVILAVTKLNNFCISQVQKMPKLWRLK